jgi:MFS family permease
MNYFNHFLYLSSKKYKAMQSGKIITRTVLLVSLVSLFTDVASEMLYPVMPVFLRSIGFSVLLIGILEGLAECIAGMSKGYFGNWSDRIGQRVPFIRMGYLLSALSKPLMALATWPAWIFLMRTLDRLGKGMRTSARDAMLSSETTPEHKGKVFGFHRGMDTAGAAIGPLMALLFLYYFPAQYRFLFLIAFFPGLIAVGLTLFLRDKKENINSQQGTNKGLFAYLSYWKESRKEYKIFTIGLLAFALFNSSDAFLLLTVKQHGFSDTAMISFYIFYNILYALLSFPAGIVADRFGLKPALFLGMFVFAGVYLGFGFAFTTWQFIALFIAYALYAAFSEGITKALLSNLAEKEKTATAIGFFTSFQSLTAFAASALGGLIWSLWGLKVMFIFSATGVFVVVIYLIVVLTNRVGEPEKTSGQ